MEEQFFLGITEDNELYSIEIAPVSEEHDYFSICGQTDRPIEYSDAVNRTRESLEDGELWKMAVEGDNTEMGLDEWIEYVIINDGKVSGIDNSCLPDEYTDEHGEVWLFEGCSGGQHKEEKLKEYFISKQLFEDVMAVWEKWHWKNENPPLLNIAILERLRKFSPTKEEALRRAVDNICA
jgi:hypothetical protein